MKNKIPLILWSIIILAFLLRVYDIDEKALGTDETGTIGYISGAYEEMVYKHGHTPLFYALLFPFWILTNHSILGLRIVAVILSMISIYVTSLLAAQIWNKRVAVLTALLLAFSPFHLIYSHHLRPYVLTMVLVPLSFFFCYRYTTEKNPRDIFLMAAVNITAFYTHLLTALVAMIEFGLLAIIQHKNKETFKNKHLITSAIITGAGWLIWLPFFIKQYTHNIIEGKLVAITTVRPQFVPYTLYKFTVGLDFSSVLVLKQYHVLIGAMLIGILLLYAVYALWKQNKEKCMMILTYLCGPIILLALIGIKFPVYSFRYLSYLVPIMIMMLAAGIDTIKQRMIKNAVIITLIGLWVSIIILYWSLFHEKTWPVHFGV